MSDRLEGMRLGGIPEDPRQLQRQQRESTAAQHDALRLIPTEVREQADLHTNCMNMGVRLSVIPIY